MKTAMNLAVCYEKNGMREKSMEMLMDIKGVQQGNHVNNNLGVIYKRRGEHEKAQKHYKTAMKASADGSQSQLDFYPLYNMAVSLA